MSKEHDSAQFLLDVSVSRIDAVSVGVEVFVPVHTTVVGVVQSCGHKLVGGGAKDFQIDARGSYSLVLGSGALVLDVFRKFLSWILEIGLVPSGIPVTQVGHGFDVDKIFLDCHLESFQFVFNLLEDDSGLKGCHLQWVGFRLKKLILPCYLFFDFGVRVPFKKNFTSSRYHDGF